MSLQETEKEAPSQIVVESLEHPAEGLKRILQHTAGRQAADILHTPAEQCSSANFLREGASAELVLGYPGLKFNCARRPETLPPQEVACSVCSAQETSTAQTTLELASPKVAREYSGLNCTADRSDTEPLQHQETPVSSSVQQATCTAFSELVTGYAATNCISNAKKFKNQENFCSACTIAEETSPSVQTASELVVCIEKHFSNISTRGRAIHETAQATAYACTAQCIEETNAQATSELVACCSSHRKERNCVLPVQETNYFASAQMVIGELKCRVIFEAAKTAECEDLQHGDLVTGILRESKPFC